MATELVVHERRIVVGTTDWSVDEIHQLKDLYSGRPSMEFQKHFIRESALLQKALRSEVITTRVVQKGETAVLLIAQVGLDLIGML